MNNIYKHFALLSILLYWLATSFVLIRFYENKESTISQHVAKNKLVAIIWGGSVAIYMTLIGVFFWKWFIGTYHLTFIFSWTAALGIAGFTIGLIVPDTKGLAHIIHKYAAYFASWLLMILLEIIALSPVLSTFQRLICWSLFVAMFAVWIKLFISKDNRKHYLTYQVVYYALFHIGLLTAVYLR